jgi:outer membrane protein TolC
MMQNSKKTIISLTILLILSIRAYGQIDESKIYSLDELFILALENNQNIKLSEAEENIAQERIAIAKNQQLPSLSASLSAYYLGDIKIFDNPFSNQQTIDMPRTGNSTILQANQLIYNGNTVNNSIKIASLQQKIASLTLLKKVQDTKLLISGYYLDLYRLMNQHQVYKNNIQLAESRLNCQVSQGYPEFLNFNYAVMLNIYF